MGMDGQHAGFALTGNEKNREHNHVRVLVELIGRFARRRGRHRRCRQESADKSPRAPNAAGPRAGKDSAGGQAGLRARPQNRNSTPKNGIIGSCGTYTFPISPPLSFSISQPTTLGRLNRLATEM